MGYDNVGYSGLQVTMGYSAWVTVGYGRLQLATVSYTGYNKLDKLQLGFSIVTAVNRC